jgi:hypothetical protein
MSTTSLPDAPVTGAASAAPAPADPVVRTYRGRTLEELVPQIREQLGPDAIVVRQRDGLMGGVGGFFQQRFVEIDAMASTPRIDVYDEPPATPESFAQLLADAEEHADPIVTAAAVAPRQDPPATAPEPESLATALGAAGLSPAFAERLLADAHAHELPFAAGDERAAVRRALARRIPTTLPHRAGGLAVAFAGAGSTACADALATAYVRAGRRAHAVATLDQARTRLERGAPDAVLALDLPPLPADRAGMEELARRLAGIELDELLLVVPADADLDAAHALLDRLAPLATTGIALACDDPATPLGAAVELACTTRLPLTYLLDRSNTAGGLRIAPADPAAIAERLLP